jgi:hypothetical protein
MGNKLALSCAAVVALCALVGEGVLVQRKEVRVMTDAEWTKYSKAVLLLKNNKTNAGKSNSFDDFANFHASLFNKGIHNGPQFLPWHRAFLVEYESALQKIAKDNTIFVPYWDWTLDAGKLASSPSFTDKRFGGPSPKAGACITTGSFVTFNPCIDRLTKFDGPGFDVVDVVNAYGGARGSAQYDTMRAGVEGVHNMLHVWVGGKMNSGTSPADPIFYSHHAFIDKIWLDWQKNEAQNARAYSGKLSDKLVGYPTKNVSQFMTSAGYLGKSIITGKSGLRAGELPAEGELPAADNSTSEEDAPDDSQVPLLVPQGIQFGVSSASGMADTKSALMQLNRNVLLNLPRACPAPNEMPADAMPMFNTAEFRAAVAFSRARVRAGTVCQGEGDTCLCLSAVRSAIQGDPITVDDAALGSPALPAGAIGGIVAAVVVVGAVLAAVVHKRRAAAQNQQPAVQMTNLQSHSAEAQNPHYGRT